MMNHTQTHPFHHVLLTFDDKLLPADCNYHPPNCSYWSKYFFKPQIHGKVVMSIEGWQKLFQNISTYFNYKSSIYPPLSTMIFIFNCPFCFGISQPATFEDTGIPSPTQPASHLEQWRLLARRLQAALVQTATRHEV
jgi:hypothetical protein